MEPFFLSRRLLVVKAEAEKLSRVFNKQGWEKKIVEGLPRRRGPDKCTRLFVGTPKGYLLGIKGEKALIELK